MKTGQVWNEDLGCAVSKTFTNIKEHINNMITEKTNTKIKLDITKCIIQISIFGVFELWLNDKKIRQITFNEYLRFRSYVKKVEGLENVN